jgi:protein-histidine N-methyltransferase
MSAFSFSFSGDDIDDGSPDDLQHQGLPPPNHTAETGTLRRASSSAFPIAGQPQLPARKHDIDSMLNELPSEIAYSTLVVKLDDDKEVYIPRRELWDVRIQLMAEEDDEGLGNLGKDDVRTGVYEGGFKSWESSVDVVKVLSERKESMRGLSSRTLEVGLLLGCLINSSLYVYSKADLH